MDSAEILHDDSLDWKDQVYSQTSDPAALQSCISAAESLNNKNLYLSHFSTDWAEILHDDSLDGKDQV